VQIRSLVELDTELAWRRIIWWARRRLEVPDRLPFEVVERLVPGGPPLREEHHLRPILIVMATKGSGTVRPFVRINPLDLLLYQALVDRLAVAMEQALQPPDRVFAYRQNLEGSENQFEGTPRWRDFARAARDYLEAHPDTYCLRADIAGFFLYIDPLELERSLLEHGGFPPSARDLGELLRHWQLLGIRGLPQGLPPSSPVGNFYLAQLDQLIEEEAASHVRYMDDLWVFIDSFSEGRRVQDEIERYLYRHGLTLSGEKSVIMRAETALAELATAEAAIEQRRQILREGAAVAAAMAAAEPYPEEGDILPPQEIDAVAVLELYDETIDALRRNDYPQGFRQTLRAIYRELGGARRPEAIADVPDLLARFPDLTREAMMYVAHAAENDLVAAVAAFERVLGDGRFHREYELLHICRAALLLEPRAAPELVEPFSRLARDSAHPLVRARALLTWGAQSEGDDFTTADEFWRTSDRAWRTYPFVAIQDKQAEQRDQRYERWSTVGRLHERLADSIRNARFSWRRI
jgi:hypothetical protein